MIYPKEKIFEEAAFLAYNLHWNHDDIMNMEHKDRRKWCEEVSKINKNLSAQEEKNIFDVNNFK
ncbi:DUF6760 family protein [Peptostreptococcaceae bacterium AGR-M142]